MPTRTEKTFCRRCLFSHHPGREVPVSVFDPSSGILEQLTEEGSGDEKDSTTPPPTLSMESNPYLWEE